MPAFQAPPLPHRPRVAWRHCPRCSHPTARYLSRREALRLLVTVPLLAVPSISNAASSDAAALTELERAATPVVMCRSVMTPVKRYITDGSWDKGRTNVNYCTRVLALRKNMSAAAELMDDDGFYEGMEIMADLQIIMTQLDASLYTPLFIPSDEGISVEQKVYQNQAFTFYADAISRLDRFLQLLPSESLQKARVAAAGSAYEIAIEKE